MALIEPLPVSKDEASKAVEGIREICREVYEKGLKGEDVIGPLSDIYTKSYKIDQYIESQPATPAQTTGA